MKLRYLLLGLVASALWSCSDDNEAFDPGIDSTAFTFTPAPGGAVMHYRLPANGDITGLYVYYKDVYGKDIMRSGSTAADSMLLTGFNEAQNAVPAEVRLMRRDRSESEPIAVTFSTGDSDPVAFMNSLEVLSDWGGFTITYDSIRPGAEGLFHVFYLGTDPVSGEPDTLLIQTQSLGSAALYEQQTYKIKQDVTRPIVVVRCEDLRGNKVCERSFNDVECMYPEFLDPSRFSFYCAASMYEEERKIGPEYLFDGDKKGVIPYKYNLENDGHVLCTFVAGPNAAGKNAVPMYIDFKKNKVLKSMGFYSQLRNNLNEAWYAFDKGAWYVEAQYGLLPHVMSIYGAPDDHVNSALQDKDMSTLNWKPLVNKFEIPSRWFNQAYAAYSNLLIGSLQDMLDATPLGWVFDFAAVGQSEGYRYLKLVVDETHSVYYDDWDYIFGMANIYNYISFHELEFYTKIDE